MTTHYLHSEATRERIAELWATGLSASKIGALVGLRKNSVIGIVHRDNLPPRKSPLLPKPEPEPKLARPYGGAPLPAGHPVSWGVLVEDTWMEHLEFGDAG